jgi:hypothetical protein
MAFLFGHNISTSKKLLGIALALLLLAFSLWVQLMATWNEILAINAREIDSIFHFLGGVFLALIAEWFFGLRRLAPMILFATVAVVGWELFEVLADYYTKFNMRDPFIWKIDTIADMILGLLGAYTYFDINRYFSNSKEF